jgi:predicted transcriptional regulator
MTTVTVELPRELAQRLQPLSDRLPDVSDDSANSTTR